MDPNPYQPHSVRLTSESSSGGSQGESLSFDLLSGSEGEPLPFELLSLPTTIRRRILAIVVETVKDIKVKSRKSRDSSTSEFTEDLIAVRSSCRQLYFEVGEVFYAESIIRITSFRCLNFFTSTISRADRAMVSSLYLASTVLVDPDELEETAANVAGVLEELLFFPALSRLYLRMEWDLPRVEVQALMTSFDTIRLPSLRTLFLARPHVRLLDPDHCRIFDPDVNPGQERAFINSQIRNLIAAGRDITPDGLEIMEDDYRMVTEMTDFNERHADIFFEVRLSPDGMRVMDFLIAGRGYWNHAVGGGWTIEEGTRGFVVTRPSRS
ncbi:hypothetical protein MMC19_001490 [Ptychographa xylographoides]|nr:hypothetical protein [Ptychographa xylographoides]